MTGRVTSRAVLAVAVLLTALLPAIDLAVGSTRHLFDPLASDAYYYFTVGRNIAKLGRVSFDGVLPTNGFHPVWQGIVAFAFLVGRIVSLADLHVVALLLGLQLAMLGGAVFLVGRAIERGEGRLTSLYATIPVGAYAIVMTPLWFRAAAAVDPTVYGTRLPGVYGTLWSYCNGMESACALLAYGIVSLRFLTGAARTNRDAALDGLALALLVLSRLDLAFVACALLAVMALEALRDRAAMKRVALTGVLFALSIIAYLVVNQLYCGSPMPVSGSIKSAYPNVNHANITRLLLSIRHPLSQAIWRMYRIAQLALPGAAALVQVVLLVVQLVRRRATRVDTWLAATGLGVLVTAVYDISYVELWEHGSWYNPVGTLFFSVWVVVQVSRLPWPRPRAVQLATLVVTMLASTMYFVKLSRGVESNALWADFYLDTAPKVRAFYDEVGRREGHPPRFVEVDDGIFSFSTGYQCISGKGFSLDVEGAKALKQGMLTPLGVARGFDRVTSVIYVDARKLDTNTSNDRACEFISGITPRPLCAKYHFKMEYVNGKFGVVRVSPL